MVMIGIQLPQKLVDCPTWFLNFRETIAWADNTRTTTQDWNCYLDERLAIEKAILHRPYLFLEFQSEADMIYFMMKWS
jgi:hypothetical protein